MEGTVRERKQRDTTSAVVIPGFLKMGAALPTAGIFSFVLHGVPPALAARVGGGKEVDSRREPVKSPAVKSPADLKCRKVSGRWPPRYNQCPFLAVIPMRSLI